MNSASLFAGPLVRSLVSAFDPKRTLAVLAISAKEASLIPSSSVMAFWASAFEAFSQAGSPQLDVQPDVTRQGSTLEAVRTLQGMSGTPVKRRFYVSPTRSAHPAGGNTFGYGLTKVPIQRRKVDPFRTGDTCSRSA